MHQLTASVVLPEGELNYPWQNSLCLAWRWSRARYERAASAAVARLAWLQGLHGTHAAPHPHRRDASRRRRSPSIDLTGALRCRSSYKTQDWPRGSPESLMRRSAVISCVLHRSREIVAVERATRATPSYVACYYCDHGDRIRARRYEQVNEICESRLYGLKSALTGDGLLSTKSASEADRQWML